MAMLHTELDAQGWIAASKAASRCISHRPLTEGMEVRRTTAVSSRVDPAVRAIGDDRQGFGGAQKQALALGRQGDAAGLAVEQAVAEPAFELGDLAADRAMGEVERIGGGREAAGAGGTVKGA